MTLPEASSAFRANPTKIAPNPERPKPYKKPPPLRASRGGGLLTIADVIPQSASLPMIWFYCFDLRDGGVHTDLYENDDLNLISHHHPYPLIEMANCRTLNFPAI